MFTFQLEILVKKKSTPNDICAKQDDKKELEHDQTNKIEHFSHPQSKRLHLNYNNKRLLLLLRATSYLQRITVCNETFACFF